MKKLIVILMAATAITSIVGCNAFVLKTVDPYFHGPGIDGTKFEKINETVYTYRWNWYRNVIIVTEEGLVVIDPMNAEMSAGLKKALDQHFPGQKVHTLIYSHYHLDHTRGGSVLAPTHVIAHEKSPTYWNAVNHDGVLEPTRYIAGDTTLNIGGVEIRALYLGLSHTDTLYAFHIPSERLVFTADLGLVKAVAPNGVPDRYAPGYLAAMNRIIEIDFDTFVPSHFAYGTKKDLIDWRNMMEESRRLAYAIVQKSGTPGVRTDQMGEYFDAVYYSMREKYGDWHGFNNMFVLNLVRDVVGESLGY
ncbi:MAG: MBL fold metallo-hydrolase [Gammaproteobacteria bacterium]|nr:MBL fold metallo-hydrolase [Gammaproteobacteria bacterium]MCF6261927.1 MBL fold metallo-hydrolase [Gammaproteobacteria bacterium]